MKNTRKMFKALPVKVLVFFLVFMFLEQAVARSETITVTPSNPTINVGETQQFTVTGTFDEQIVKQIFGITANWSWWSHNLALTPDGKTLYVTGGIGSNVVTVIDVPSRTVTKTITLPGSFYSTQGIAISPDGSPNPKRAYIGRYDGPIDIMDLEPSSPTFQTIIKSIMDWGDSWGQPSVGRPGVIAFTPDGAKVYVTNETAPNLLSAIDANTETVQAKINLGSAGYSGFAISPDGDRLYIGHNYPMGVAVINTATNTPILNIDLSGFFGWLITDIAITPDETRAYVADWGSKVIVIDLVNNVSVKTIPITGSPHSIAISPDGKRAYVGATNTSFSPQIIDTDPQSSTFETVIKVISGGFGANGIIFSPDGQEAYLSGSGKVAIMRTHAAPAVVTWASSNTAVATIDANGLATGLSPGVTTITATSGNISGSTTLTVESPNRPPVANAGPDQTVHVGSVVTLDGSGSSDPDGNVPLTYEWSFISVPGESTASLSDPAIVNPTFTPDIPGDYVIQLIVTDSLGAVSEPDTVIISTTNTVPVADAGTDQLITIIGTMVQLDGNHSYDVDGDPVTYQWTFVSTPAGSTSPLNGANTVTPTFVADVHGDYVVQLVVNDPWTQSLPDTVTVSFENLKPVANAGTSQSIEVGDPVTLDGSGSSDANGDYLTYWWTLSSLPEGSLSVIANPIVMITTFIPDLPGAYVVQLIVNDSFVDSDPSTIQIQAATSKTVAIKAIQDLETKITSLPPNVFKNANMQNTLINKLNAVIANIEAGNYADAIGQLQNDISGKTDGCANSGAPDKNDWIKDCGSQGIIYPYILDAITKVEELL